VQINVGKANKVKISNLEIVRKLEVINEKFKTKFKEILDL
jgi:hypothetical protein